MKYDREKHVELVLVNPEALTEPTVLRFVADLAETPGMRTGTDYIGLRVFRDKTDDELASAGDD